MPYVSCKECGLMIYSAALWSGAEECPRCGVRLPLRRATSLSLALERGLMRAARAHEDREPAEQRGREDG